MQGVEYLYVILAVAFLVPFVIMWRTRMIRLEAHIEIPPEEDATPVVHVGSLPPASWVVSDAVASGETLQPIRAGSLRPILAPSQRPQTITDGSPKLSSRPEAQAPLPMPVRRPIEFVPRAVVESSSVARASGLPVPLRPSVSPERNEDS